MAFSAGLFFVPNGLYSLQLPQKQGKDPKGERRDAAEQQHQHGKASAAAAGTGTEGAETAMIRARSSHTETMAVKAGTVIKTSRVISHTITLLSLSRR